MVVLRGVALFALVDTGPDRRVRSLWSARLGLCVLLYSSLFLCTACEHWIGLVEPGAADSTDIGDDDVVQRATLTVTVTVSGEDQVLAELVGSTGGVLRDAEVVVERLGSTEGPQSATTDRAGRVEFEELLAGDYSISVIRVLTPEEVAQFPSEDADVNAFGGGARERSRHRAPKSHCRPWRAGAAPW
jgi:hypothetical protein